MAADGVAMEPMATRSASDVGLYPADEDEPMMTSTRKKEKLSTTDTEQLLPEDAAVQQCCCRCGCWCWVYRLQWGARALRDK